MKYTDLEEWKQAAAKLGFTIMQSQGRHHFHAIDQSILGQNIWHWSGVEGHLPDHPQRRSTDVASETEALEIAAPHVANETEEDQS